MPDRRSDSSLIGSPKTPLPSGVFYCLVFVDLQPEQPFGGHLDTDKPVVPCCVKHRQPASSDLMLSSAARGEPSRLVHMGASDGESLWRTAGKTANLIPERSDLA